MPSPKVLLFTYSYNRPHMLRQCILNSKNQSYSDFKHIIGIMSDNLADTLHYNVLFDDILDYRYTVGSFQNSNLQANFLATMELSYGPHDIYIKIDDDDIYKAYYVETIVNHFNSHQDCDILTSAVQYQLNNYFMTKGHWQNLGGIREDTNLKMPMTLAFSHKAFKVARDATNDGNIDDILWRNAWYASGLKDQNVDNSSNIVWHIHGKNISTKKFFRER